MKLPRRIADILKRKQNFINSQRNLMENSVIKAQVNLLSEIISSLTPQLDVKDGLIQDTPKNYRLISLLDKAYKNSQIVYNQIIFSQIVETTSQIGLFNTEYFNSLLFKEGIPLLEVTAKRFERVIEKTNKLTDLRLGIDGGKPVRGGFIESFFNSNTIGTDLKQMTSKAVTSNMDMKDYTKLLKDKITGTPEYTGGLERQFQRYAYDIYQQYDAAYNLTLGNEFGFTYFIYQGGLIDDSRDFCAAHNGKVWSLDEMKEWTTWTPVQGEYPAGYVLKAKDLYSVPSYMNYPGYDPGIDRGGYNCRHSLGWLPDDMAFEMRPELKDKRASD